jgi:hypothetical protein
LLELDIEITDLNNKRFEHEQALIEIGRTEEDKIIQDVHDVLYVKVVIYDPM